MSPALTAKYQTFISEMSKQNNDDVPRTYPQSGRTQSVYPLANATEIIEIDPEDLILPVGFEDPVDFIIELSNDCEDLQYIADKTNEHYGTAYTEDDVQTIINDYIEAITAE